MCRGCLRAANVRSQQERNELEIMDHEDAISAAESRLLARA
jgi:hypothetical protein